MSDIFADKLSNIRKLQNQNFSLHVEFFYLWMRRQKISGFIFSPQIQNYDEKWIVKFQIYLNGLKVCLNKLILLELLLSKVFAKDDMNNASPVIKLMELTSEVQSTSLCECRFLSLNHIKITHYTKF